MDQIQKQVSEMAIRLSAFQSGAAAPTPQLLEELEILAWQVLSAIEALRRTGGPSATETGIWPVMNPRR